MLAQETSTLQSQSKSHYSPSGTIKLGKKLLIPAVLASHVVIVARIKVIPYTTSYIHKVSQHK